MHIFVYLYILLTKFPEPKFPQNIAWLNLFCFLKNGLDQKSFRWSLSWYIWFKRVNSSKCGPWPSKDRVCWLQCSTRVKQDTRIYKVKNDHDTTQSRGMGSFRPFLQRKGKGMNPTPCASKCATGLLVGWSEMPLSGVATNVRIAFWSGSVLIASKVRSCGM